MSNQRICFYDVAVKQIFVEQNECVVKNYFRTLISDKNGCRLVDVSENHYLCQ